MRQAVVSKEFKSVVIEGYKIVIGADGTPSIETVQVSAQSASELDKVAKKHGLTGAKVVQEITGLYAVTVNEFVKIARPLSADESRRDLITRTIEYNKYTLLTIEFGEDGKPFVGEKRVEADARIPQKKIAEMYHAQVINKTGSRSVLMGCTTEDFLKIAKPHTR